MSVKGEADWFISLIFPSYKFLSRNFSKQTSGLNWGWKSIFAINKHQKKKEELVLLWE